MLLGLFGEVGSLLSALKKKQRDRDAFVAYHDDVIEELGDTLWYFANVALRADLSLSQLALRVPARLDDWDYHGRSAPVSFPDLQRTAVAFTGPVASEAVEHRLLALAGKVGHLLENWSAGGFLSPIRTSGRPTAPRAAVPPRCLRRCTPPHRS